VLSWEIVDIKKENSERQLEFIKLAPQSGHLPFVFTRRSTEESM
jgi:hypothetical protein